MGDTVPNVEHGYVLETSDKNNSYAVGYPVGLVPKPLDPDSPGIALPPFVVEVDWPVDNEWHQTSQDFANETGITAYQVGTSYSPFYIYFVEIVTNEHYNYKFYDQTGESYDLDVFVDGDHVIRYNSQQPTIGQISGS
ncbi:hypothetical protein PFICI_08231 [Pestalotiopsis fici W106-1]|uniref:Uncharacterized protein n=1 Tax=Pestalotiopsis fici (strain W106-1 / CGMCC3.15140) TaxID=1229662 RepID=W3X5N2_PESFW|nr:uncharacterized protein PFICI_08231 [Pestalotiopsis fici W106-1]ETS80702.1 hypothetical protein PFICI_08231 [Pestalotiopsis fici W106-1]